MRFTEVGFKQIQIGTIMSGCGRSLVEVKIHAQPSLRRWSRQRPGISAPTRVGGSRPICFDDVFDGPAADRAAGVDLSLELQPAVVAQAHVPAGVNDCVHLLVEANGAFSVFPRRGQF